MRQRKRDQFYFTIKSPSPPIKVSAGSSATADTNLEHCFNNKFSLSTQNTHHYRVYFLSFKRSFLYISCTQKSFIHITSYHHLHRNRRGETVLLTKHLWEQFILNSSVLFRKYTNTYFWAEKGITPHSSYFSKNGWLT